METINTTIPSQKLTRDLELNGIATGTLVVPNGVYLRLNGTISGDLAVEEGGSAEVNGTITGSVDNRGGRVTIRGVVRGAAFGHHPGGIMIEAGAIVGGRQY